MVNSVLLPEPLAPITATRDPGIDREIDAVEGLHLRSPFAINLGDVA